VRAGEPDRAEVLGQFDPVVAQVTGDVLLVVGVAGDPGAVGQDGVEVGHRSEAFQAEALPRGPVPGQPGGPGQGADRRRSPVQVGPPDLPGFEQRDVGTELSRLDRGRGSGRPAAQHQHSHGATSVSGCVMMVLRGTADVRPGC